MILLILEEFHFYNMSVFRNYGVFLQNNFGITQHNSVQIKRTIKKNWRKIREIEWTRKNSISRENYVLSFYSGMYKIHLKFANNSFKDNLMPLSSMPNDSGHFAGICGGKYIKQQKVIKSQALTKTVDTELIYNLSPTKKWRNPWKSLASREEIHDLVVITYDDKNGEKLQNIRNVIQGDIKDLGELKDITDWNEIAKLHGTNDAKLGPDHIRGLLISKSAVKDILLLNEINQSQVLNYIGLGFYWSNAIWWQLNKLSKFQTPVIWLNIKTPGLKFMVHARKQVSCLLVNSVLFKPAAKEDPTNQETLNWNKDIYTKLVSVVMTIHYGSIYYQHKIEH